MADGTSAIDTLGFESPHVGGAVIESVPTLLLVLCGLALVDSVSIGTLGLPVWMLAQPRIRPGVILVYLGTIAAFYWLVGVALLTGLSALVESLSSSEASPVLDWVQLAVGVALFGASFLFDGPGGRWRRARRERSGRPSRWQRWRTDLVGEHAVARTGALTALGAGLIEVATMLPYLAAIGLLSANGVSVPAGVAILAAYSLVMIVPALVLLALRLSLARVVERPLARMNAWFSRSGDELLAWTLGIVGFFVAADALSRLSESTF